MLGFVLGRNGDIQAFMTAMATVGDRLSPEEFRLLRELVSLTRYPGNTVNMAQKLECSSAQLEQNLAQLKADGLIDYWGGTATATPRPVALSHS